MYWHEKISKLCFRTQKANWGMTCTTVLYNKNICMNIHCRKTLKDYTKKHEVTILRVRYYLKFFFIECLVSIVLPEKCEVLGFVFYWLVDWSSIYLSISFVDSIRPSLLRPRGRGWKYAYVWICALFSWFSKTLCNMRSSPILANRKQRSMCFPKITASERFFLNFLGNTARPVCHPSALLNSTQANSGGTMVGDSGQSRHGEKGNEQIQEGCVFFPKNMWNVP